MSVLLTPFEKDLLMELQYNFPQGPKPFHIVADRLGVGIDDVIQTLTKLKEEKKLKRIGFYVNYRSKGLKAALIAYSANGKIGDIAEVYARDPHATHVYQRDHPVYDLWIVTKRPTLEEIVAHAEEVSRTFNVDYVVLYSVRTYKLSVKYDLYRGVSRSGNYSTVNHNPPSPAEYGVDPGKLSLFRRLEISPTPYKQIAGELGISEEEASKLAWNMLKAGILGDPGAALDGHRIGFTENAMVVLEPRDQCEEKLCNCIAKLLFTTHVVQRASIPAGKWRHTCYFMVHATSKELIEEMVSEAIEKCEPKSHLSIKSIADLKPGVVR